MQKKNIMATSLGNVLEWFDYGLFIFLAPVIGKQFFPNADTTTATFAALSVFAAGFICRPLGGIFFGHRGDTKGRGSTLRISILLITFSTLLVGLLPTYQTVGILAPILFTGLRMIQGFSVGGEYTGVMIYLAESAPESKRGLITSLAASGANLGFLLATLTVLLLRNFLPAETLESWGWRLPFIGIGIFGSVIAYYRLVLPETTTYLHLQSTQHIQRKPLRAALKFEPIKLLQILGLTCMSSTLYYVFFGYMPDYLPQYIGISTKVALQLQSVFLVIMLCLVPFAGICGDRFGRRRMLLFTATGIILLVLPCFYLIQTKILFLIIISLSIATILSSLDQGNILTTIVEVCPAPIRYSGIAFSYNLGNALFGGTAPLIVSLLTHYGNPIAPAYYLMGMAAISLFVIITLPKQVNISAKYPNLTAASS